HARGLPGSHVLLRLPPGAGKADPPDAALRQGACLAARHSRGREAGKLEVDWVPFQNVRRPRGARPGLVTIRGQKTLTADPAEGERLLEELEEIE
ncbi:MAG: fibronectin/fibrinogen-binding protein, partial [Nitrospinota bacterium]|nr:fibronectin/fibrinogen-binding protein [Nitrospinota bacterium]